MISAVYDDAGRHIGFAKVTRDQSAQREHEQERKHLITEQTHLLAVTAHELRTPTAVIEGSVSALEASPERTAPNTTSLLANIRQQHAPLATPRRRPLHGVPAAAGNAPVPSRRRHAGHDPARAPPRAGRPRRAACTSTWRSPTPSPSVPTRTGWGRPSTTSSTTPSGTATLPSPSSATSDDGHVRIRVTDAGPGVPERLEPRLFERFVNAGSRGGTGLGLYLVREITLAHGGEVEYHPRRPGRPPTFEIRLPRTT